VDALREEKEFIFFEVLSYRSFYLIDVIVMRNVKDKVQLQGKL
jgi:hypothetical protein